MKELKFNLFAIVYNNGDVDECGSEQNIGVYFEDREDAVSYLENQADIVIDKVCDIDKYNFDNIDNEIVNIFIRENKNHIAECESLYENLNINNLKEHGSKLLTYHDFLVCADNPEIIKIYKKEK